MRVAPGFAAVLMASACASAPAASAQAPGEVAFRAMFKEMVETDTSFATGDCTALANKIAARMKAAGFPAGQIYIFVPAEQPKAGNLVAVLPGRDPKAKAVLMLGHIDVVNARRQDWLRDPFVMIEEGGKFYGRCRTDLKTQLALWADYMVRYTVACYRPARILVPA